MGQPLRSVNGGRRDESLRRLTRREIEEQIAECVAEVAAEPASQVDPLGLYESDESRPRTLSSRELVRSMRKFIVYN